MNALEQLQKWQQINQSLTKLMLRDGRLNDVVLSAQDRKANSYTQRLAQLEAYDEAHKSELLKTLTAFLEHGYSLAEAARILHVHRNTLIKRLQRVEQICGVDLRKTAVLLNLHVALLAMRLHRQP